MYQRIMIRISDFDSIDTFNFIFHNQIKCKCLISEPDRGDSNTAFFLEAAEQAEFEKVDLAPCKNCGRKFARDRLDKHLKVLGILNS